MSRSAPATCRGTQPSRRPRAVRSGCTLAFLLAVVVGSALPAGAQTAGDARVRRAIAAYDEGRLERALAMLDSVSSSLPARDGAVLSLYRGLIQFTFGETVRAHDAFARAVELDPRLEPDPAVHSPSRVRAFDTARDSVIAMWRSAAARAESNGELQTAAKQWQSVLLAVPDDSVAAARLAAVHLTFSSPAPAPASPPPTEVRPPSDSVPIVVVDSARAVAPDPPADGGRDAAVPTDAAAARLYSPQRAALLGVIFPGLGEVYTDRPLRGAVLMGAAVGAVAFGYMTERLDVRCLSVPVDNFCPPADVLGEATRRPYLLPSIGVAAALTIAGAIDAYVGARRANERALRSTDGGGISVRLEPPSLVATPRAIRLELLRVRF